LKPGGFTASTEPRKALQNTFGRVPHHEPSDARSRQATLDRADAAFETTRLMLA
jgi:hypothetical protein